MFLEMSFLFSYNNFVFVIVKSLLTTPQVALYFVEPNYWRNLWLSESLLFSIVNQRKSSTNSKLYT